MGREAVAAGWEPPRAEVKRDSEEMTPRAYFGSGESTARAVDTCPFETRGEEVKVSGDIQSARHILGSHVSEFNQLQIKSIQKKKIVSTEQV